MTMNQQFPPGLLEALQQMLAEQDMERQSQQFQYGQGYPNALQGGIVNPMQPPQPQVPEPAYPDMGGGRGFSRGGTPYPEFDMPSPADLGGGLMDTLGAIGGGIGNFASALNPFDAGPAAADELGSRLKGNAMGWPAPLPPEILGAEETNVAPAPAKKKKGEFSDFFKALKAAKSGNKDVKKSFAELAKQLDSEVSDDAKATGTPTI